MIYCSDGLHSSKWPPLAVAIIHGEKNGKKVGGGGEMNAPDA